MLEISFLISMHIISFLYGIGILKFFVVKGEIQKYFPIICTIGYALIPVFITILYSWGIGIPWISYIIFFGCLIFGFIGFFYFNFFFRKENFQSIGLYFLIICLFLAPKLLGGDQFSVFQGNVYDHFNYLTSTLIYSIYDYTTVESATILDFLKDPLIIRAQSNLESRPSIMLFFSALGYFFGGKYIELAYILNLFFLLQTVLVLTWISRYFGINLRKGFLIGLIFCGGFWGQLIFDMNAWSHLSSLPLLILFVSMSLNQLSEKNSQTLETFLIFISITGSLYLYPEATIFLGFGIGILTLIKIRSNFSLSKKLILAAIMAFCVALINFESTLLFLVKQISFSLGETPGWYQYYFSFLFGNDGIANDLKVSLQERVFDLNFFQFLLIELLDLIPGIIGIFFLTPSIDMQTWNSWLIRLLINGFVIGLLGFFIREIFNSISNKKFYQKILLVNWSKYIFLQTILIIILIFSNNIWTATKGWLYLIPFLFFLFFVPFFSKEKINSTGKIFLFFYIASQLSFALIRPFAASESSGIHYKFKPYPGSLPQAEKELYSWEIESIINLVKDCKTVLIPKISNPFYEHFIMLVLKQNKITFQKTDPINLYYSESDDIGEMKRLNTDCNLELEKINGKTKLKNPSKL